MKPDECILKSHLEEAPFLAGVDAGKWALCGEAEAIVWPMPIFWIRADQAVLPAGRIFLRFNMENYPQIAPTACPWNAEKNIRLEFALWPKGPGNIAAVFNPNWNGGTALYAPCDRMAMAGHDAWQAKFPEWWWQSHFTIAKYLEFIHKCTNPGYEKN